LVQREIQAVGVGHQPVGAVDLPNREHARSHPLPTLPRTTLGRNGGKWKAPPGARLLLMPHDLAYTRTPPTNVCSTRVVPISSGAPANGSRSSTARSASLPTSIVPVSSRWFTYALPAV